MWRLLYTGFQKNGVFVKMSLEEAAQKVKISKKSLDDYLMQLRSAKKFGFDFETHSGEKVGVIRSFVRKKKDEERKRIANALANDNNKGVNQLSNKDEAQFAMAGEEEEKEEMAK